MPKSEVKQGNMVMKMPMTFMDACISIQIMTASVTGLPANITSVSEGQKF